MANYKITTGPKAYSFNDQATGITIARGEVKTITPAQFSNRRIQKALITGHLRQVMDPKDPKKYTEKDVEKLVKKLMSQYEKGIEPAKAAKSYSLEEAKLMAHHHELEPDDNDTVVTLIEAIYETFEPEAN